MAEKVQFGDMKEPVNVKYINNAGIYQAIGWDDYNIELVHKVINTNLIGVFMMSQSFARQTKLTAPLGNLITLRSVAEM